MFPIDFFWRAAARWPERTAIDTPEGQTSYATLAAEVAALAAALQALDATPQSRVGICAQNSREHLLALLAIAACGKVWVPLNPKSTASEIKRILDITEPSILFADAASAGLLTGAQAQFVWTGPASQEATISSLPATAARRASTWLRWVWLTATRRPSSSRAAPRAHPRA
jgi:fatty-acyl-CoA synthase